MKSEIIKNTEDLFDEFVEWFEMSGAGHLTIGGEEFFFRKLEDDFLFHTKIENYDYDLFLNRVKEHLE